MEHAMNAQGERNCANCGKLFVPGSPDVVMCAECVNNRAHVLDHILAELLSNAQTSRKRSPRRPACLLEGYESISLLGTGSMGEVWKVRHKETGETFALKTMLPKTTASETAQAMFLREMTIHQHIRHKNVLPTYEVGERGGVLYILMELSKGGTIGKRMAKSGGKLSLELATSIILQVLSGLDYVHSMDARVLIGETAFKAMEAKETMGERDAKAAMDATNAMEGMEALDVLNTMDAMDAIASMTGSGIRGIVHRDLKPGNIFLSDGSEHPVAKIADFGMAKAYQAAGFSGVTLDNSFLGTPQFIPRQQAENAKYAKPEVDVWAAAACYYYMLTGHFPKDFPLGKHWMDVLLREKPVPILQRDPTIPVKVAHVIDRALVEEPEIGTPRAATLKEEILNALPQTVLDYCEDMLS